MLLFSLPSYAVSFDIAPPFCAPNWPQECTASEQRLHQNALDIMTTSCEANRRQDRCQELESEFAEQIRQCNRESFCDEFNTLNVSLRSMAGCGLGIGIFLQDTLEWLADLGDATGRGLLETFFCGAAPCTRDPEELAERDRNWALEIALQYADEESWCEEQGGCTASDLSCTEMEQACRLRPSQRHVSLANPDRDLWRLENCSSGVREYFSYLANPHISAYSPSPFLQNSGEFESMDHGAQRLFQNKTSECRQIRQAYQDDLPDLLEQVQAVFQEIIDQKRRELSCFKLGYQAQVICQLAAEIGLVEGGLALLVARISQRLRHGVSVSTVAREISQEASDELRFLSPEETIPADFTQELLADLERLRAELPDLELETYRLNENLTHNPDLPTSPATLADTEVMEYLGLNPGIGFQPQYRHQLQTRIASLSEAEQWASAHGWSPEGSERLFVLSEDFTSRGGNSNFGLGDFPVSEGALARSSAFSFREGWFNVQIHGTPGSFSTQRSVYQPEQLAEAIRRAGHDGQQPINLLSCWAATGCPLRGSANAQELADELGVPVVASTTMIEHSLGSLRLMERSENGMNLSGEWRVFLPQAE